MSRARSRDRRVYLRSHPILFALLAATRHRPTIRVGRTVLVHDREAYLTALTRVRLDRTAVGTTGGAAGRLAGPGVLFDQQGHDHRATRRTAADLLDAAAVERARPAWRELLAARLAAGGEIDLVPLAVELAGATAAALLGLAADPVRLAEAAREAAAAAARAHLPGIARRRADGRAEAAVNRLLDLVAGPLAATFAVAAISTTVAALPRTAAWACDDGLWDFAATHPQALADELLRVVAPTPLLPRVPAVEAFLVQPRPGDGAAGRCPVRPGDRMLLVARHAADAHRRDPDPLRPAPAREARLIFGAGPHACPGARLARVQTADFLAALAPLRPVVVRARADRHSALPGWASLVVRPTATGSGG